MSPSTSKTTYAISSWLFGRSLGAVTVIAFASLGAQAQGLFGEQGVVPVELFVDSAKRAGHTFWQHPSALWWSPTDGMISFLWIVGLLAGVSLLVGFVPKVSAAVCWFAYLSFVSLGWPFMSFQWDTLLLETCFTAVFFVPMRAWDRPLDHRDPHPVARWALWWLLARLVFRSAYVKLASGDATWADLTALEYHYWTQPLPTVIGWYAVGLPGWFQTFSCAVMFAIELLAPLALCIPRVSARRLAALAIASLMVLVALTGNYGFFNLLTVILCIPLLDDSLFRRTQRERFGTYAQAEAESRWNAWPSVAPGLVILLTAAIFFGGTFGDGPPRVLAPVYRFGTFNNYGLFAVMTTERPEIEIEGTDDGSTWLPYRFRYKPGPVDEAPSWVAPHQPRLDWQMWFAALGDYRRNVWLGNLMRRLLEGEPEVLDLLDHNPFADAPPKQVRALIYRYTPTTWSERAREGRWWKRDDRRLYAPILGVPVEPSESAD